MEPERGRVLDEPARPVQTLVLQSLSESAFARYGRILEPGDLHFPDGDEEAAGRIAIYMLRMGRDQADLQRLSVHFSYEETFAGLAGTLVIVVGSPPKDRIGEPGAFAVDWDQLSAFTIEAGQAVTIDRGVWHNVLPLGDACQWLVATRRRPAHGRGVPGNSAAQTIVLDRPGDRIIAISIGKS
jgi:ureidoglycolate hydrolase